ncbi:MAG: AgmX/PglI C-terminal domain-containing protein [Kofleriaceae bacterium]
MKRLLVLLAACGSTTPVEAPLVNAPPAKTHGDLSVRLGECVAPNEMMVSGPRSRAGQVFAIMGAQQHDADEAAEQAKKQPTIKGSIDKAAIRAEVRKNKPAIAKCYETALQKKPDLAGTVQAQFTIDKAGKVMNATAFGVDPGVATCVAKVIEKMAFPKPNGGGIVVVNYPFAFKTADTDESGGSGTAMALDEGKMGQSDARQQAIEQARAAGILGPPPGVPLESVVKPLGECATAQAKDYGTFAVEWTPDAKVSGVDDPAFAKCLTRVAQRVTGAPNFRCGVAFGVMPPVELTSFGSATYGSEFAKLPQPSADRIVIRGPVFVKPAAGTAMRALNTMFRKAVEQHVDLVLDDLTGKPLVDITVPAAPVTATRAGSWTGLVAEPGPFDESVKLSILLSSAGVTLGMSRVNEFITTNLDGVEARLKEDKASAFFADRLDIEIAAEDDATYDDLVRVIQIATKVGFVGWKVYVPEALTARPHL